MLETLAERGNRPWAVWTPTRTGPESWPLPRPE